MARQYSSGTSTDGGGSGPTNAATIVGLWETAILAHSAWSLVETLSPTNMVHKVYKCASGSSGLLKDFYVVVSRTTASGAISISAAEDYNSTTHVLTTIVTTSQAGTRAVDGSGIPSSGNSLTLSTLTTPPNNTAGVAYCTGTAAATSFWALIADTDGLMFVMGTVLSAYVGAYTPLATISDPMPLCLLNMRGANYPTNGTTSGVSRQPGVTTPAPAYAFGISEPNAAGLVPVLLPAGANIGTFTADLLLGGNVPAFQCCILHYNANQATVGTIRGLAKHLAQLAGLPSGAAVADTILIGGTTWLFVSSTASFPVVVDTGS